jgi:hypothetical protein
MIDIFGNKITQLETGVSDNFSKNTQAHIDLQSHIDQTKIDLFVNHDYSDQFLKPSGFLRIYDPPLDHKKSIIGYKGDTLQSIKPGTPNIPTESDPGKNDLVGGSSILNNSDIFLSSFFCPSSTTYLKKYFTVGQTSTIQYKKYPFMVANHLDFSSSGLMSGIYYDTGVEYEIKDISEIVSPGWSEQAEYNDGKAFKMNLYAGLDSNNLITGSLNYNSYIAEFGSSFPSVSIKFSIERTIDPWWNADIGGASDFWVGLFLINQPIWKIGEEVDLSKVYRQTDAICSFVHLRAEYSAVNDNDFYFPKTIGDMNVTSASLCLGRIKDVANTGVRSVVISSSSYPDYLPIWDNPTSYSYIEFESNLNSNSFQSNGGLEFNPSGIGGLQFGINKHIFSNGPRISELKLEWGVIRNLGGDPTDFFVIFVLFNGEIVEKFLMERNSTNIGAWVTTHLIPGIILNAPEGMIKIHDFSIDMD